MGMEKPRPILSVRLQFSNTMTMVQCLLVVLPGSMTATFLVGAFFFIILSMMGAKVSASGIFAVFFALSLVVIPPVFYEIKKRAYKRTAFNFYQGYLDFQYFRYYLNRRRGRVRYADIVDVSQHASMLQEHQRLITIDLYIPAMGLRRQGDFSGLHLTDVPRSQDYLTKVIDLIEGRVPAAAQKPAEPKQQEAAASAAAPPTPASPSSPPPVTDG